MKQEIRCHLPVDVVLILQGLSSGAYAEIIITGEAGVAGEMRSARPHGVIALHVGIRAASQALSSFPAASCASWTAITIELRNGGWERVK